MAHKLLNPQTNKGDHMKPSNLTTTNLTQMRQWTNWETANQEPRVILKWRWRPAADTQEPEEWKLLRSPQGLRPVETSGTWPGRPRSGIAGAGLANFGLANLGLANSRLANSGLVNAGVNSLDFWEKHVTTGLCYGCGGDWNFKGALKVDVDSSEYTGYRYYFKKPGYRIKSRSCEDARFIHINFVLLAEVRHFEKVSFFVNYFYYLFFYLSYYLLLSFLFSFCYLICYLFITFFVFFSHVNFLCK